MDSCLFHSQLFLLCLEQSGTLTGSLYISVSRPNPLIYSLFYSTGNLNLFHLRTVFWNTFWMPGVLPWVWGGGSGRRQMRQGEAHSTRCWREEQKQPQPLRYRWAQQVLSWWFIYASYQPFVVSKQPYLGFSEEEMEVLRKSFAPDHMGCRW